MKTKYRVLIAVFLVLFINTTLIADSNKKGNEAYKQENYTKAFALYSESIKHNPTNPIPEMNLGNVLFELEDYENALKRYENALEKYSIRGEDDTILLSDIYYNRGLIYFKLGKHQQALSSFEESLKLTPDDEDAKYNWFNLKKLIETSKSPSTELSQEEQESSNENEESENQNEEKPQTNETQNENEEKPQTDENQDKEEENKQNIGTSNYERQNFLKQMNNKEIINRKNTRIIKNDSDIDSLNPKYEKDW